MTPVELVFEIPRNEWHTLNDRLHWAQRARRAKRVRARGMLAARGHGPVPAPVLVEAEVCIPTNRVFDPHNAAPVIKALVDGCVDGRLLEADDSDHLTMGATTRGPKTRRPGWYQVTLRFTPIGDAS